MPRRELLFHLFNAVFALGILAACYVPGPPPRLEETVAGRLEWSDASLVPPEYRRVAEHPVFGPYYVLVSLSGHYCVVPDVVFVAVRDNERWACDWRPRRTA